uniref:Mitochondrial inner membrane protein Mpv17 n=1 Tax=Plectus sambesii TaxID=2011161 RepID=A0A914VSQ4_9BILA
MALSRAWNGYLRMSSQHPWKTTIVGTGLLMATGDLISQKVVEKKPSIELSRTMRFAALGVFYVAPVSRAWFVFLQRNVNGSTPLIAVLKRVACDQFLFAPLSLTTFLFLNSLLQGKTLEQTKQYWRSNFPEVYRANLYVWPGVQLLNFSVIPLDQRVLFVQVVALFWNIYLAFKTQQ